MRTYLTHEIEIDGIPYDLSWEPSCMADPIATAVGSEAVVTYLVDAHDTYGDFDWEDRGVTFTLFRTGAERDEWIERNVPCSVCGNAYDDCVDEGHGYDPDLDRFFGEATRRFLVERYEHGLVRYALMGESSSVDRRWDVAPGVAVIELDDQWSNETTTFADIARGELDQYTSWCNGDVYGIIHEWLRLAGDGETWEAVSDEATYGYLGGDDTEALAKAEHQSYVEALANGQ